MNIISKETKNKIIDTIKNGGTIAYPTEGVYGLGCDPFNLEAVERIAKIKGREINKGFIVIASSWEQITPLITKSDEIKWEQINASWPGPNTWVFPCSDIVPSWISGSHKGVAIRLTDHPVAKAICEAAGQVVLSTSANYSGEQPSNDFEQLKKIFVNDVDLFVEGELGGLNQATPIRDALTGKYFRQ